MLTAKNECFLAPWWECSYCITYVIEQLGS